MNKIISMLGSSQSTGLIMVASLTVFLLILLIILVVILVILSSKFRKNKKQKKSEEELSELYLKEIMDEINQGIEELTTETPVDFEKVVQTPDDEPAVVPSTETPIEKSTKKSSVDLNKNVKSPKEKTKKVKKASKK